MADGKYFGKFNIHKMRAAKKGGWRSHSAVYPSCTSGLACTRRFVAGQHLKNVQRRRMPEMCLHAWIGTG